MNFTVRKYNTPDHCGALFDPSWLGTPPRHRVESLIVWCLMTLVFVPCVSVYFRYRRIPDIKLRSPFLTLFGATGGYLAASILLSEQWFRVVWDVTHDFPASAGIIGSNYGAYVLATNVLLVALVLSYPTRALRLLFVFRRQVFHLRQEKPESEKEKLSTPSSALSSRSPSPLVVQPNRPIVVFLRRAYMKILGPGPSEAKFFLALAVVILIFFFYGFIPRFQYRFWCNDGDNLVNFAINTAVVNGVIVALLAIVLFLLRNVRDEFTINNELRAVIVILLLLLPLWLGLVGYESDGLFATPPRPHLAFPPTYILVLCVELSFFASVLWPLLRLLRNDATVEELVKTNSAKITLEAVLDNKESCEIFRQFLVDSFCVENLQYYEAVRVLQDHVYSDKYDTPVVLKLAKKIVRKFIVEGSKNQVNISAHTASQILREMWEIEQPGATFDRRRLAKIFQPSVVEVVHMMKFDSFSTFQLKPAFVRAKEAITGLDTDEVNQVAMLTISPRSS